MTMILKALGALLTYPDESLVAAAPEVLSVIEGERMLSRQHKAELRELLATLAERDLLFSQEVYVDTFDRGRAASLHLFEHVHGESRDRGMAMVDLRNTYERAGLVLRPGELPDYLPVVLEYLSVLPEQEAREMLVDCAHILRKIGDALAERGSGYSAIPAALLALVQERNPAQYRRFAPSLRHPTA